jgi:type IV secretory pathway VirB10-like protein
MWTEIRAQRARRGSAPAQPSRARRIWIIPAVAAAILVIGIAIGRLSNSWMTTSKPPRFATRDSTTARVTPPVVGDTGQVDSLPPTTPTAPRTAPNAPRSAPPAPRTRSQPFNDGAANMAYRLAVVEHLAGTEAMLTSFRAAAKPGEVDAQITSWARNLLTTTRLLQASAAQDDPTMKRLLDDLELVLVQIAQYTSAGTHHAEELELIEHSIERRGVIGKLHTNIPARLAPAGT